MVDALCQDRPLVVALSGPSSSGKTTIANSLQQVLRGLCPCLILHADDFYKPDSQIPVNSDGLQDWDCEGALDIPRLRQVLKDVRVGQSIPKNLIRQGNNEDDEILGDGVHHTRQCINPDALEAARKRVELWPPQGMKRPIVIIDGFLLFGHSLRKILAPLFDVKILLRTSYTEGKRRRENRNGFVTLEGFWQDPPAYFDKVVWPNYVREHAWLFENGDVEKEASTLGREDHICISAFGPQETPDRVLSWVIGTLGNFLCKD